jgi:hypothetical protein
LDTLGKWMRRIGLWLIAAYAAFGAALWLLSRVVPGRVVADLAIRALFYADAWLFLGALIGVFVLNAGTAWGLLAYRSGRTPAPFTRRELGAAVALVLFALAAWANSGSRAEAVVVPRDTPAPVREYKELYPQRTSLEHGDLERRLGEEAALGDVTVKVTKTQLFHQRGGEFEMVDPGYYLIVFYDVTNRGRKVEYFSNEAEWAFDVPGKGRAEPVFPSGPMDTGVWHEGIEPGATVSATVALYLGPDRAAIAPGDYFAIWEGPPCMVSDANYEPKDYCRAVWPIGKF